ncbi:MAG: hypothetical protein Q4C54_08945, partial [Clostridia bacterium]|nr:hypothetical protein [Clostridia bacterium]
PYSAEDMLRKLRAIGSGSETVVIDVTGGTEAALFGAGAYSREANVPAFTYSRKANTFYNIYNAEFAQAVPCRISYSVDDFVHLAGGRMKNGRVDNNVLARYLPDVDDFFQVYLKHQKKWTDFIIFMQRISRPTEDDEEPVSIEGSTEQKGESGRRVHADEELMRDLEQIGFLHDVRFTDDRVSFRIRDRQIRAWLRDVGSVLELYVYKACLDSHIFGDVICSAIIDWSNEKGKNAVTNEIDVVAARGVVPLFISCKTCDVKTEALNELAILSGRFGGKGAKSVIVTAEACSAAARHRAAQLGITVIDAEELRAGSITQRLKIIMKAAPPKEIP